MLLKLLLILQLLSLIVSADIQKAKRLYKEHKYKQAIEELKYSTNDYANPQLHLLWAQSAEKLGQYEEAMSAYERVLIMDPQNRQAKQALEKIYQSSQRTELQHILTGSTKSTTRSSLSTLSAKVSISGGYDTNANYSASSSVLNNYYGFNAGLGNIASLFSNLNANIHYLNDLDEKGGWFTQVDLNGYHRSNASAHFYDTLIGGVSVGGGYYTQRYTLLIPLTYNTVHYLDVSFFDDIIITPQLIYALDTNFVIHASCKYSQKTYNKQYKGMETQNYGIGYGINYTNNKNFLDFNIFYENYSSLHTLHYLYVDKSFSLINIYYRYKINTKLDTSLNYHYRYGSYDDVSNPGSTSLSQRTDSFNQVEVKLLYYFNKIVNTYFSQTYARNISNFIPAKYDKSVSTFGINLKY